MDRFEISMSERFGEQLWGREQGKSIRDEIIESFLNQRDNILLLNFSGVTRIDFSCASEIVSILILRLSGELKGKHLIISGLSKFVEENIDAALDKAELCGLVLLQEGAWKMIGKYSETLVQTLDKVITLGQADTPAIADALNIAVTSCNNRLKTLVNLGMVSREEHIAPTGGKQYIYKKII